jgi:myo-inositol-1(or 4)-monophosphatase
MDLDLQQIAEFTLKLARQAGELMQTERQNARFERNYKSGHELVTSVDVKVDALVRHAIEQQYPDHLILSEESAPKLADAESLRKPLWIIDPIDGTVNFAHNHHQVAVSIAFAVDGKVQVGVVHCPFQHETFHAIRGQYSKMNDQDLQVSGLDEFRNALLATGFPYEKSQIAILVKRLHGVLNACADIRRIGSAAIDICWVAMGRLDGFYESLSPWDFAAGRLIAQEAGARCGHLYEVPEDIPEELYGRDILVVTPALYDQLKAILTAADQREG